VAVKKITVDELVPGMYVEALDRPWLETDYELEGVQVTTAEDIARLRRYCTHVFITDVAAADEPAAVPTAPLRRPGSSGDSLPLRPTFPQELARTRVIRNETKRLVDGMHDDIRAGRSVNTAGAREAVEQMVDSVAHHPDALAWFTTLKNRDEYTALHSMHVCMLAITLASFIGLDDDTVKRLGIGALLHDVGKIKIPLAVLNKPGKLTDDEFALMKKHPEFGVEILEGSPDLTADSLDVVLSHHERCNGSGYPRALVGDAISFFSQLVAIIDVYDAMTSDRVYHDGRSPAQVLKLMRSFTGDFNPKLLAEFVRCIGDYPIGSLVELNTGEVGFVVPSAQRQDKPTVLIVLDHHKQRYYPQRVRDLMRFPKFTVVKTLACGAYGVDVEDYAEFWG
jgi:putative nucleotidyltransferase with HDIG domain